MASFLSWKKKKVKRYQRKWYATCKYTIMRSQQIYSINLAKPRRLCNDLQPTRNMYFPIHRKHVPNRAYNWKLIAVSLYITIYEMMRQIVGSYISIFWFFTIFPNVTSERKFMGFPVLITNQCKKFGGGHKKSFQLCFCLCFHSCYSSLLQTPEFAFSVFHHFSFSSLFHIYTFKYSFHKLMK